MAEATAPVRATDLANGYYTVPAGRLVNAVTWFEMREPPRQPIATDIELRLVGPEEADLCRSLFIAIGTPWLWSRAFVTRADSPVEDFDTSDTFFAWLKERPVGLVAFDRRAARDVEITWFGLTPDATGRDLGRGMMAAALSIAWGSAPDRVWLHTCSFDHPAAPRFYHRCGFRAYAAGFEVMEDPRLTGEMPRHAAPHVPLIEL